MSGLLFFTQFWSRTCRQGDPPRCDLGSSTLDPHWHFDATLWSFTGRNQAASTSSSWAFHPARCHCGYPWMKHLRPQNSTRPRVIQKTIELGSEFVDASYLSPVLAQNTFRWRLIKSGRFLAARCQESLGKESLAHSMSTRLHFSQKIVPCHYHKTYTNITCCPTLHCSCIPAHAAKHPSTLRHHPRRHLGCCALPLCSNLSLLPHRNHCFFVCGSCGSRVVCLVLDWISPLARTFWDSCW